jgi:23S rRNA (guanine2445-N2)-methyltransferase / 23S rRNA (guanine2069-N7)-methyltransferase
VLFQGELDLLYRSLLWSRIASRILLQLTSCSVREECQLYQVALEIDWPEIFAPEATFATHFIGTSSVIRHSHYGSLRIKDAIVDRFQQNALPRPRVDRHNPELLIEGYLQRDRLILSLDLSGHSLHQRGYRQAAGEAPLKENLAAALVRRSGWQPGETLIDPMCGAGTLLIEAALLAADIAPGLQRQQWGFNAWSQHQPECWQRLLQQAQQRASTGVERYQGLLIGYDKEAVVLQQARLNAQQAGVASLITFAVADVCQLTNPCPQAGVGTLLTNPPYGERLSCPPALLALYSTLAQNLKQQFAGWRLSLLSQHSDLFHALQLRAERQFKMKNGPLECVQKNYRLAAQSNDPTLLPTDLANRLAKKQRQLGRWAHSEGVNSYRLYDADLPDYNVAIDRYADYLVVQEYQPSQPIEEKKRQRRLAEVLRTTSNITQLPAAHLIVKVRQRQRGHSQYQKLAQQGEWLAVLEYGATLWVNLTDYVDTGLFLDHRRTRRLVGQLAPGKDFLNLFCYTASATVHAGRTGARSTTSVDLSKTYLNWAARNLQSNDLLGSQHYLIQADCLTWMATCHQQFDLILVDPPTFSCSKRMTQTFEVQRDQLKLFTQLRRLLRPQGLVLFSNNRQGFQLDYAGLQALELVADEITAQTRSPDFNRARSSHRCWKICHRPLKSL